MLAKKIIFRIREVFRTPYVYDSGTSFDADHGIDTERINDRNIVRRVYRRLRGFSNYQALPVQYLSQIRKILLTSELKTLVDIGSGKGCVLFYLRDMFDYLIGVEYFQDLHELAIFNAKVLNTTNIEFVNIDASCYRLPSNPCVVFIFNPFGEKVMTDFLTANLDLVTKDYLFIYVNPVALHVFEEFGFRSCATDLQNLITLRKL